MTGVSNTVSLYEAQQNYLAFGAAAERYRGLGREPFTEEVLDKGWRPLDLDKDSIEEPVRGQGYAESYPWHDTTVLYYWRSSFWRRLNG